MVIQHNCDAVPYAPGPVTRRFPLTSLSVPIIYAFPWLPVVDTVLSKVPKSALLPSLHRQIFLLKQDQTGTLAGTL